jgi:hypothetical protein
MRKLFDVNELNRKASVEDANSSILVERFLRSHDHRIDNIKQLAGKLPEEGEIYFMWTVKSFNAFTFIPYVIQQTGCIDELTISTYSISTRIVDALIKLIENDKVKKVHLLISDSLPYRLPKVHDHLQALTKHRHEITVCYAWNHSKIALMQSGNYYLVVEGSGNFGENAQHEQYIFYNSPSIFKFRKTEIHGLHTRTT